MTACSGAFLSLYPHVGAMPETVRLLDLMASTTYAWIGSRPWVVLTGVPGTS